MSRWVEPTVMASSAFPGSLIVMSSPALAGPAASGWIVPIPGVSRGRHDHYTRAHELVDFDAKRALAAGEPLRLEPVPDAHVDAVDQNASPVAVDLLDVRERRDQIARLALAVGPSTFRLSSLHLGAMPEIAVRFSSMRGDDLAGLVALPADGADLCGQ